LAQARCGPLRRLRDIAHPIAHLFAQIRPLARLTRMLMIWPKPNWFSLFHSRIGHDSVHEARNIGRKVNHTAKKAHCVGIAGPEFAVSLGITEGQLRNINQQAEADAPLI